MALTDLRKSIAPSFSKLPMVEPGKNATCFSAFSNAFGSLTGLVKSPLIGKTFRWGNSVLIFLAATLSCSFEMSRGTRALGFSSASSYFIFQVHSIFN